MSAQRKHPLMKKSSLLYQKKNLKEKVISINMSKELESWIVYTLTSVCIFSILFSIHFLRCCQRELFRRSRASLIGDRFLYSFDHNICETTPSANHWLQNVKSVLTYLLRGMPQIRRQTMSKINTKMGHRTWYLVFLPFFFCLHFSISLFYSVALNQHWISYFTRINRVTVSDELRILFYLFGQL